MTRSVNRTLRRSPPLRGRLAAKQGVVAPRIGLTQSPPAAPAKFQRATQAAIAPQPIPDPVIDTPPNEDLGLEMDKPVLLVMTLNALKLWYIWSILLGLLSLFYFLWR